jgi:methylated-DNA-[protein]-cysteine S-methyltransferase
MTFDTTTLPSPIGPLTLFSAGGTLYGIDFGDGAHTLERLRRRFAEVRLVPGDGGAAARRVRAYFDGELGALDDLDTDTGGTEFQRRVWRGLRRIPVGAAVSYGELARAIGSPAAVRAVGGANHDNPVPVVIPCHRVIGVDGTLTGYGGGLDKKRWLLAHEGVTLSI